MIKMPYKKSSYNPSVTPRVICFETCRTAHFSSYERTKTFEKISGSRGANCWHPLKRWMVLALTERSFPAHLHSSLLVEEAGQGICNINTVPAHVRKELPPHKINFTESVERGTACVHGCVDMRVERGHIAICYPLCFGLFYYSSRCAESSLHAWHSVWSCATALLWNIHEALFGRNRKEIPKTPAPLPGTLDGDARIRAR